MTFWIPSREDNMHPLLKIEDLCLSMNSFDGEIQVLSGINLEVKKGEIWGIVGETGSGKSITGMSISRLVSTPPAKYQRGKIELNGLDLLKLGEKEMRKIRGNQVGMIFQDPTTNLNPAFRIGDQLVDVALSAAAKDPSILGENVGKGWRAKKSAARALATVMLEKVGIPNAAARLNDYPHQFSGGMRQRVLIALALIGRPSLLIADEPTTALDVSVQAQILKLIKQMVKDFDMGIILITHSLGVVAETCSHVAVMYAGRIVEKGSANDVITSPEHPYTQALLASIPTKDVKRGELRGLPDSLRKSMPPPIGSVILGKQKQ